MGNTANMIDNTFEAAGDSYAKLLAERNLLVRAARALANLDRAALLSVTPPAMQAVCRSRGWYLAGSRSLPGDPKVVGMEVWDNDKATSGYIIPCVQIPMHPTYADYPRRVAEWATDVATRHGDVSPVEILAEALLLVGG
jgi:hypothetical protein